MQYNEFWKLLGDFWSEYYRDKPMVESLWGAWNAIAADQQHSIHQANLSKCIYTIPVHWKRFWVPFDTPVSALEFDLVDMWDEETNAVTLAELPQAVAQFNRPIDPETVEVRDEFGVTIARENFIFDYWNGTILAAPGAPVGPGDQVVVHCHVCQGSASGDPDRVGSGYIQAQQFPILVGSERVYSVDQGRWLERRSDYSVHYKTGRIYLTDGGRVIIKARALDLETPYPYKYQVNAALHAVPTLYSNTRKLGKTFQHGTDFTLDGTYIRFKTEPEVPILWAEEADYNFDNVWRVFGSQVGYKADNSIDYYRAVFALYYFLQHQPSPKNLAGACQAILGLPVSFTEDKVHTVARDAAGDNLVTTAQGLVYNLGNKLPSVSAGEDLSILHPLTDEVKIHDRVNNKGFLDLLFTKPNIYTDRGFRVDDGHKADSMWSADGFRRLFMKYHTFVVEVTNPEIFQDALKVKQLRFMLQNRAAWTVYVFLFNMFIEESVRRALGGDQTMIDDHRWAADDYWAQPFDGRGIPPVHWRSRMLTDHRPHADEESNAVSSIAYHFHATDVVSRFFGIMNIYPGEVFSPYRYTFVEARDTAGQTIPGASFDPGTCVVTVPEGSIFDRMVTVVATRVNKLTPEVSERVIDRVRLSETLTAECFRTTVFYDTLRVFGANQTSGEVTWSACAESEFSLGAYAEPRTYIEQVSRAYRQGADFAVDDETGLISFPTSSRMTAGQRCLVDFSYIGDRAATEAIDGAGAVPSVVLDPTYDMGRERVDVEEVQGTYSEEDRVYNGTTSACEARAAEEGLRSPYGVPETQWVGLPVGYDSFGTSPFGGRHYAPLCFQVVPRAPGETLRSDVLGDPPTDSELSALRLSREQMTSFSDAVDGNYLGDDGPAPYPYRYALDPGCLFVSRLSSAYGDYQFREFEYLAGRDFVIDGISVHGAPFEIRFKEKPANTVYYLWRYRPEDYPVKTGAPAPLVSVDTDGPAEFPLRYTLAGDFNRLTRLTSAAAPGHPYGEADYHAGTDFVVDHGFVCFAAAPAGLDYHAWDYVYLRYKRVDERTIPIGPATFVGFDVMAAPYPYRYRLPRAYSDIQILSSADAPGQEWHGVTYRQKHLEEPRDYSVAWTGTEAEIRFRVPPVDGVYEAWHYFMRAVPDGAADSDAVVVLDSYTDQPMLRVRNNAPGNRQGVRGYLRDIVDAAPLSIFTAVDYLESVIEGAGNDCELVLGYRTDRLEALEEITAATSYVYRLDGPSAPILEAVSSNP